MSRTVLETWEELPVRKDGVERFDLPEGGATLFVVHRPTPRRPGEDVDGFRQLAADLQARVPGSTTVLLPEGWCFRVVRYDDERREEAAA